MTTPQNLMNPELVNEMARLWWTDPFQAARKTAEMQKAALDGMKDNAEQAITMGRKNLDDFITAMDSFDPKKRQA